MIALTRLTLRPALAPDYFKVPLDSRNAILHATAVGFQLRFTFTTAHADATLLPRQVAPKAGQTRQQMLQLRQLNLKFAFTGPRALGENIQDERGAVEHLAVEDFFQVAALGGRKLVIENDGIDVGAATILGELVRLTFADESA